MNLKPLQFRVPSRSEEGVYRIVEILPDGNMSCSCPARPNLLCHHKKEVIKRLTKFEVLYRQKVAQEKKAEEEAKEHGLDIQCDICKKWFNPDKVKKILGKELCAECREELKEEL